MPLNKMASFKTTMRLSRVVTTTLPLMMMSDGINSGVTLVEALAAASPNSQKPAKKGRKKTFHEDTLIKMHKHSFGEDDIYTAKTDNWVDVDEVDTDWKPLGTTIAYDPRIVLHPDVPDRYGFLWANSSLSTDSFDIMSNVLVEVTDDQQKLGENGDLGENMRNNQGFGLFYVKEDFGSFLEGQFRNDLHSAYDRNPGDLEVQFGNVVRQHSLWDNYGYRKIDERTGSKDGFGIVFERKESTAHTAAKFSEPSEKGGANGMVNKTLNVRCVGELFHGDDAVVRKGSNSQWLSSVALPPEKVGAREKQISMFMDKMQKKYLGIQIKVRRHHVSAYLDGFGEVCRFAPLKFLDGYIGFSGYSGMKYDATEITRRRGADIDARMAQRGVSVQNGRYTINNQPVSLQQATAAANQIQDELQRKSYQTSLPVYILNLKTLNLDENHVGELDSSGLFADMEVNLKQHDYIDQHDQATAINRLNQLLDRYIKRSDYHPLLYNLEKLDRRTGDIEYSVFKFRKELNILLDGKDSMKSLGEELGKVQNSFISHKRVQEEQMTMLQDGLEFTNNQYRKISSARSLQRLHQSIDKVENTALDGGIGTSSHLVYIVIGIVVVIGIIALKMRNVEKKSERGGGGGALGGGVELQGW